MRCQNCAPAISHSQIRISRHSAFEFMSNARAYGGRAPERETLGVTAGRGGSSISCSLTQSVPKVVRSVSGRAVDLGSRGVGYGEQIRQVLPEESRSFYRSAHSQAVCSIVDARGVPAHAVSRCLCLPVTRPDRADAVARRQSRVDRADRPSRERAVSPSTTAPRMSVMATRQRSPSIRRSLADSGTCLIARVDR